MELELGLALPNHSMSFLDLNCEGPKEMTTSKKTLTSTTTSTTKRLFYEAFEDTCSSTTLPLLWTRHPPKDDDRHLPTDDDDSHARLIEKSVVGWPPVNSWRKKRHTCAGGGAAAYNAQGAAAQSLYVKVNMDGAAIGRKIDLSNCDSYHTLTSTLNRMFDIDHHETYSNARTRTCYTLTYQDKEGDWLLVGDATWETFIQSVQRLKIQKKGQY